MLIFSKKSRCALKGYYFASSVEEALADLMAHRGEGRVIGGGMLLMPQVQRGETLASRLIDVSRICTMRRIAREGQYLVLGGATTFAALLQSDLVRDCAPALREAAQKMGLPSVRHLATLGGNIVAAQGNTHGCVALVALDAEVEIANSTGAQWLPIQSVFVRYGVSRVDSTSEIATSIRVHPLAPGQGAVLECMTPSDGQIRSSFVLSLLVSLSQDGTTIDWSSVAMGSTHGVPMHLADVEEALCDLAVDDPRSRDTFAARTSEQAMVSETLGDVPATCYEEISYLATRAFDRAVKLARHSQQRASSDGV